MKRLATWALLALISTCGAAFGQSNPGLVYKQVPTATQWNSYFSAKQDTLNFTPVNRAGDIMTGKLTTAAPSTGSSGFNLSPGVAPLAPVDGDVWTTSVGAFVRYGGTVYQIQTGSVAIVCSQLPSLTGDVTSTACATTVGKVNGVTYGASPSTNTVPVISASNTATYTAVPNCTSGYLQFSTSTHLFTCGAAGSGTVTSVATTAGTGLASSGTCSSTSATTCTLTITTSRPSGCQILSTAATTCADGSAGANNGTYTTPAGATWLEITCVGNGGGGAGSGTTPGNGGNGGNVTITGTGVNITCGGGNGAVGAVGGTGGGSASGGYMNIAGNVGGAGSGATSSSGGVGCSPPEFGGGGYAGVNGGGPGSAARANSGGGGGGGGVSATVNGGGGGQCGGFVKAIVSSPPASLTYAISGTTGTAGTAGTGGVAGGAGAAGQIIIIPHFGA